MGREVKDLHARQPKETYRAFLTRPSNTFWLKADTRGHTEMQPVSLQQIDQWRLALEIPSWSIQSNDDKSSHGRVQPVYQQDGDQWRMKIVGPLRSIRGLLSVWKTAFGLSSHLKRALYRSRIVSLACDSISSLQSARKLQGRRA